MGASAKQERNNSDEFRIQRHFGPTHTRRRYLGDHKYLPKRCFEREETALDTCRRATAIAGLDPLVFPRATRSQGVKC